MENLSFWRDKLGVWRPCFDDFSLWCPIRIPLYTNKNIKNNIKCKGEIKMYKKILRKIETLVNGETKLSEGRIYVKFVGIQNASILKQFMSNNGFDYVYGAYDDGVYELGFSEGEGA